MRRILGSAAIVVLLAGAALGQGSSAGSTGTQTEPVTGVLDPATTASTSEPAAPLVSPQQRARIKALVPAGAAASGKTLSEGATLPASVELRELPSDVGLSQYRYAVVGKQAVVVAGYERYRDFHQPEHAGDRCAGIREHVLVLP